MPIPECPDPSKKRGLRFADISVSENWIAKYGVSSLEEILRKLRSRARTLPTFVHLDPDIRPTLRHGNEKALNAPMSLGQSENALSELRNCRVQEGDLFLFFGRFQPVLISDDNKWSFKGRKKHIFWGWLQIGKIIDLSTQKSPSWAEYHPHVRHHVYGSRPYGTGRNVLYQASDSLTFATGAGAGTFSKYVPDHNLTSACLDCRCDWWDLPSFFFETGCAQNRVRVVQDCQHPGRQAKDGWSSANFSGQGQEFVFLTANREQQFLEWLNKIFNF